MLTFYSWSSSFSVSLLKSLFISIVFLGFSLAAAQPNIPLVVGGQVEFSPSLTKDQTNLSPFLMLYSPDYGNFKLSWFRQGFQESLDSSIVELSEIRYFAQLSVSLNRLRNGTYGYVKYISTEIQNSLGDNKWDEWAFGIGGTHVLHPYLELMMEIEYLPSQYRIESVGQDLIKLKETGLNINLGFIIYIY